MGKCFIIISYIMYDMCVSPFQKWSHAFEHSRFLRTQDYVCADQAEHRLFSVTRSHWLARNTFALDNTVLDIFFFFFFSLDVLFLTKHCRNNCISFEKSTQDTYFKSLLSNNTRLNAAINGCTASHRSNYSSHSF